MYALTSVYARYHIRSNICACAENMSETQCGCCSRMTFDRLVSPPKKNQYACAPAYVGVASGLFKIGISSVQTMLEKKGRYGATQYSIVYANVRNFSETAPRPRLFTPPPSNIQELCDEVHLFSREDHHPGHQQNHTQS